MYGFPNYKHGQQTVVACQNSYTKLWDNEHVYSW